MNFGKKPLRSFLVASVVLGVFALYPQFGRAQTTGPVDISFVAEAGFVAPVYHTIQYGKDGNTLDYIDEGGQDSLFPVLRVSAELTLSRRHTFILLYQPLDLRTQATLGRDIAFDDVAFASGTAVNLRYGFDFYRLSYLYDFFESAGTELGLGLSLQIRNAAVVFSSADGQQRKAENNIGPVPALKLRARQVLPGGIFVGGEIDGIWAPIKYFNGSGTDVEGALLDASVRVGYEVSDGFDVFLNVRYLGGGAEGGSDDYTENWLQFLTTTVGVVWTPTRR